MTCESDLLIVGGGPAGLSAAINGASEALRVRLLDNGALLGGQARESAAIENYPGFPEGATGNDLMGAFVRQARKFGSQMVCPVSAAALTIRPDGFTVITDDYQEFSGRALLVSLGLSYRRLNADGLAPLMGRGVFYGRPPGVIGRNCRVAVIGGANSAGQAVVKLASNPTVKVKMIVRKLLTDQMSAYLIERIRTMKNVEVMEGCEVTAVSGDKKLEWMTVKCRDSSADYAVDQMHIFIGATPRTLWLKSSGIEMDAFNYIQTWKDVIRGDALPYETSVPGIFAAGDVRSGSIKRIASAIGEGAGAMPMIHRYLANLESVHETAAA